MQERTFGKKDSQLQALLESLASPDSRNFQVVIIVKLRKTYIGDWFSSPRFESLNAFNLSVLFKSRLEITRRATPNNSNSHYI